MSQDNKHTAYDLAQMQSLPLDAKIRMSIQRIKAWYEHWDGQVYVAISGGKDSQVLAHLVQSVYPDVQLAYVRTGLEYSSVDAMGVSMADIILKPAMDFQSVIKKFGYPLISKEVSQAVFECKRAKLEGREMPKYRTDRFYGLRTDADGKKSQFNMEKWAFLLDAPFMLSHYCCNEMKKKPSKKFEHKEGLKPFLGTLASESKLRKQKWIRLGCNAFEDKRPTSQPLSFWTEQDILAYIKRYGLEIASVYGDVVYKDDDGMRYDEPLFNESMNLETTGVDRTGCVFCMFGITQDKDKFLRLKKDEPQKYDFVMRGGCFDERGMWIPDKGLGYKFVIDWLNEHGDLKIKY